MPYRRLPNTDSARIRALKAAYDKGKSIPPFHLAYSQSTFAKVELFINSFEKAMAQYKAAYNHQVEKGKDYQQVMKRAKLYVSHFIQVLNMAINRGEHQPSVRELYGMDLDESRIPSLNTEKDLIEWGKKIIDGEMMRMRKNQPPITNPTIAIVKVRYEQFIEVYNHQKILQQNTQRTLKELNTLRTKADEIILSIWNEVETYYTDLPDDEKREKATEYGLIYVYRKNEIKGLNLLNRSLPNLFG
ncbi:MAG: hypothetical protein H6536_08470 [Bacteroidales bacterium]|nr:hypothetical protein [Bacteroidales bacterium]